MSRQQWGVLLDSSSTVCSTGLGWSQLRMLQVVRKAKLMFRQLGQTQSSSRRLPERCSCQNKQIRWDAALRSGGRSIWTKQGSNLPSVRARFPADWLRLSIYKRREEDHMSNSEQFDATPGSPATGGPREQFKHPIRSGKTKWPYLRRHCWWWSVDSNRWAGRKG